MREVKLPSGATLKIGVAPFDDSRALFQAVLKEAKAVEMNTQRQMGDFLKDLFCTGFSSREVQVCLDKCLARCTVDGAKIDGDTFEPAARREDYIVVCTEVLVENISPFAKSLFAQLGTVSAMIVSSQA